MSSAGGVEFVLAKANISMEEKHILSKLVKELVKYWSKKR